MNPPNSDGKGPGTPTGANGPKPETGKPETGKPEMGIPGSTSAASTTPAAAKPGSTNPGSSNPGSVGSGPAKPIVPPVASPAQPAKAETPVAGTTPVSTVAKPSDGKPADVKPTDQKPDAAKAGTSPSSPVKADAPKAEPVRSEPPKSAASSFDAGKAGGPKPDLSKPDPAKSEPAKPAGSGPIGAGAAASNPSSMRNDAPKAGAAASGPQSTPQKAEITDGPIIDLKAKRISDPTEATKTGPASSATKPSGSTTFTGSPDKPSAPSDTKSAGSTTPKIGPAVAVPEPRRGGAGFGSVATAGLLGGVIGAGLLFAVERSGALGVAEDGRIAALDQKIAALAPKEALAALDKRIGANEAGLKPLQESIRSADATAKEALQKAGSVSAVPTTVPTGDGSAPAATLPPDLMARLDGLDQRVAALQEEPGRDQSGNGGLTAITPQTLTGLEDRLKAVEGKVDTAAKPAANDGLASQVTALKGALETRTKANAEAGEALNQKLASLQQTLESRVKAATEAVQTATQASQQAVDANKAQAAEAAKGVERLIQAQSEKIAGLDQALASRAEASTVQAAMRVVAADRIVGALNTGSPYADALAALRSSEPGDPAPAQRCRGLRRQGRSDGRVSRRRVPSHRRADRREPQGGPGEIGGRDRRHQAALDEHGRIHRPGPQGRRAGKARRNRHRGCRAEGAGCPGSRCHRRGGQSLCRPARGCARAVRRIRHQARLTGRGR